jgi:hypothetical protein
MISLENFVLGVYRKVSWNCGNDGVKVVILYLSFN